MLAFACVLLMGAAAMGGCSKASNLTCKDYLGFDESQREGLIRDLLNEHDLQTWNAMNQMILRDKVQSFCSNPDNENVPLENAANWNNTY